MKFGFLPFVVVTIVAMVFFSAVFAARAPAMGNSADRVWQLSQLVEGVLTAFNPSYGCLSCVKTNCGVVRVAGYSVVWDCDPTPVFLLKSTKRSAAAISRPQRSFISFSWCASEYFVVGRISCHDSHDSIRTNVCQWYFWKIETFPDCIFLKLRKEKGITLPNWRIMVLIWKNGKKK